MGDLIYKLRNIREVRDQHKTRAFEFIFQKVQDKILEYETKGLNMCIYSVPNYLPGHQAIDVRTVSELLIGNLNQLNGIKAASLENVVLDIDTLQFNRIGSIGDILITWTIKQPEKKKSRITI